MNVPVGLIWIKKRERRPATIGSLVSSSRRQTELGEACGLDSRVPIMSKPNTTSYRSQSATQLGEVRDVEIPPVGLPGILHVPQAAYALVVFAHGSASSRLSPRNTIVANALNRQRLATLLFDLLTPAEEADRANVFDIPLLATRLVDAVRWVERQPALAKLPLGLFGASTGAAAALVAAAKVPRHIGAGSRAAAAPTLPGIRLQQSARRRS